MQVILTEDEYLKLKIKSEEDKQTYVKRIDVGIALKEFYEDLSKFVDYGRMFDKAILDRKFKEFVNKL